jgi:hypothetical protein
MPMRFDIKVETTFVLIDEDTVRKLLGLPLGLRLVAVRFAPVPKDKLAHKRQYIEFELGEQIAPRS